MAACYVALALANSFVQFLVIFIIIGVANAASTVIPCSLVITNWFGERRGLALGIAFAAIPLGGTWMTIFESHIVSRYGWRVGFVTQAVPIAVIALPLLIGLLRTRPSGETPLVHVPGTAQILLSGLEVRETLRTRSFWLIAIAQFLATAAAFGIGAHFIPYLIGIGYSPILAAEILSGAFVISALGNFVAGPLADRLTGRVVLALAYVACAVGLFSLLAAAHVGALAVYITTFALVAGVPPVVLPLVIAESMGLKRLGSVLGLEGIFAAVGAAVGPIVAGRIFDVSGTYAGAIWIFVMMTMVSAIAIYSCRPLEDEQTRIAISTKAAASV
jgi:MFS family permease